MQSLIGRSLGATNLDKVDPKQIRFPVDLFQVFQDLVAFRAIFVIYKNKCTKIYILNLNTYKRRRRETGIRSKV